MRCVAKFVLTLLCVWSVESFLWVFRERGYHDVLSTLPLPSVESCGPRVHNAEGACCTSNTTCFNHNCYFCTHLTNPPGFFAPNCSVCDRVKMDDKHFMLYRGVRHWTNGQKELLIDILPRAHFAETFRYAEDLGIRIFACAGVGLLLCMAWCENGKLSDRDKIAVRLNAKRDKIAAHTTVTRHDTCRSTAACPMCYERFVISVALRVLPCAHTFHKRCIDGWFARIDNADELNCPDCKACL